MDQFCTNVFTNNKNIMVIELAPYSTQKPIMDNTQQSEKFQCASAKKMKPLLTFFMKQKDANFLPIMAHMAQKEAAKVMKLIRLGMGGHQCNGYHG